MGVAAVSECIFNLPAAGASPKPKAAPRRGEGAQLRTSHASGPPRAGDLQAAPLPPRDTRWQISRPLRRSSSCAKPADPAGIAITGVTAGGYWHWRQCVPNWRFCQPSDNALDVDLAKRSDMALVRKRLPASRSRRADRLCSVTLLVPENCAEGLI